MTATAVAPFGATDFKKGRPPPPLEQPDLEEAVPFSRQISPKCRLVDCSSPSPTCADTPDVTRLEFSEFRRKATLLADEFFMARDTNGMVASIRALGCPSYHDELAALLLRSALDRGESERRSVVGLLVTLEAQGLMSNAQLVRGFEKLVLAWDDIQLDVPDAPGLLVAFLSTKVGLLHKSLFARLPEELLRRLCSDMASSEARDILQSHLHDLASFKRELAFHLQEDLFCNRSVDDFASWLRSAGKPAYHHEVVAGAGWLACEEGPPAQAYWAACLDKEGLLAEKRGLVLKMLAHMLIASEGFLLDEADVQIGFSRLLGSIGQRAKEGAGTTDALVALLAGAVEQELLPAEFLRSARRMRFGGAKGVEVIRKVQRQTPLHSRRIWGSGDKRHFREEEREAVLEYFDSRSVEELAQIVEELHLSEEEQAHFLRTLLVTAMERGDEAPALEAVEGLLNTCWSAAEVQSAFEQLRDVARDLVLDFPYIREKTTELVKEAAGRGLLDESFLLLDGTTVV